ncbi:unnamed protein product [Calicophoron daubneyi]|uniref:Acetyl-CoA hydrolase n=1 Tax=Calicophoron daubneyi TaxID=300641 RepID=A0AAV2T9Z9_CALDB
MFRLRLLAQKLTAPLARTIRRGFRATSSLHYEFMPDHEPFCALPGRQPTQASSGEEAFYFLKDGANVFIQGGAATPSLIVQELHDYIVRNDLKDITIYHLPPLGPFPFFSVEEQHRFRANAFYTAPEGRKAVQQGKADYMPIFLSEIPLLFNRGLIKLDVALISITPPDKHGLCSLGPSLDVTRSAILNADHIVAQVNNQLPLCRGDASVHISHVTVTRDGPMSPHTLPLTRPTEIQEKIGTLIAENLINDGATIQAGTGGIPSATLSKLMDHRDLGIHTDIFSDEMVRLVETGAVTNRFKEIRPGKIVACLVLGTSRVFDFIDDNPVIDLTDAGLVCSSINVALNPQPIAIATCMEMDITGQAASDSLGTDVYSGFGGKVDFLRGAFISQDHLGKAIIAFTSLTKDGKSKIVPFLKDGTGVVNSRAHIHYVVTEYGIADLFGKNIRQRAHALIQIAHPKFREGLERSAFEILNVMPSPD